MALSQSQSVFMVFSFLIVSLPMHFSLSEFSLDINATMKAIEDFMAFDFAKLQETYEFAPPPSSPSGSPSSPIGIPMYDVDMFLKPYFKDYFSLLSFRFASPERRAKWLADIANVTSPLVMNSTPPWQYTREPPKVYIPFSVSGASYGVEVSIGNPGERVFLLVDTGSALTWFTCIPCNGCPLSEYDSRKSFSFHEASCQSKDSCPDLPAYISGCDAEGKCNFSLSYFDRTTAYGYTAYDDIMTIQGDLLVKKFYFGCVKQAHESFLRKVYFSGLMGFRRILGPTQLSILYQMKATSFSMCFPFHTETTTSKVLYFNYWPPVDEFSISVPLLENDYKVEVSRIIIDGELIRISPGSGRRAIIDSGTAITRLPHEVYNRFRDTFKENELVREIPTLPGIGVFDTCFDITYSKWVLDIPPITFVMTAGSENRYLTLTAKQVMVPVGPNTFCLAFAGELKFIIGTWQLQGTRVSFDLVYQMVQFDPRRCSTLV